MMFEDEAFDDTDWGAWADEELPRRLRSVQGLAPKVVASVRAGAQSVGLSDPTLRTICDRLRLILTRVNLSGTITGALQKKLVDQVMKTSQRPLLRGKNLYSYLNEAYGERSMAHPDLSDVTALWEENVVKPLEDVLRLGSLPNNDHVSYIEKVVEVARKISECLVQVDDYLKEHSPPEV